MDAIKKIEPVEQCFDGFLCRAWGESDKPCAEVVRDLAGVRHFLIREWLGGEDDTDADGELTLPRVMAELESQNWEADEQWSAEFEIGGVSVEPVYSFSALASKEAELAEAGLKYVSLFGELQGAMADIERLKAGLKWYADGKHVAGLDDDWDTVSGEPQNWLCGPESGMVENGGVAKTVLDGGYIVDDDEIIAEPAMTAEQHKTKLARVKELIARNPDADSADGMELQQLAGEVERHAKRVFGPALTQPTE